MRQLVFISHANPEDNNFALWLGLQLTREGYQVWSDITKLIGGESFWSDIEDAIRNNTIKFLYILSRESNVKQGSLDELYLARTVARTDNIRDFIIPLRIDDLPFQEINVALHRLNVIDFTNSWAQGLARLLEKLAQDNVFKDLGHYNPLAVSSWWKGNREGSEIIKDEPEICLSNWFPILDLPENIFIHLPRSGSLPFSQRVIKSPYPRYSIQQSIVSFAPAVDLNLSNCETISASTPEFIATRNLNLLIEHRDRRNAFTYLLRTAWIHYVRSKLPLYKMANNKLCSFFTEDKFKTKFQTFNIPDCGSGKRTLTGKSGQKAWHFAISADIQLEPILSYIIFPHVLFSDDGVNIWQSTNRLHKARRTVCKNWWNDHWRDRILASMYWLSQQQGTQDLLIPISSNENIKVSIKPVTFESPISYEDLSVVQAPSYTAEYIDDDAGLSEDALEEVL